MKKRHGVWGVLIFFAMGTAAAAHSDCAARRDDIYGRVEKIALPEFNFTLPAKMDTGATSSSIDADSIEKFQREGDTWVRFKLSNPDDNKTIELERKVTRFVSIRPRTDEIEDVAESSADARPVVMLEMCIGPHRGMTEVNLVDRGHFSYPLLVGRKTMSQFHLIINPRKKFTHTPTCQKEDTDA